MENKKIDPKIHQSTKNEIKTHIVDITHENLDVEIETCNA
jgi:hypothetical protein